MEWLLILFVVLVLFMMKKGLKLVEDDTPEYQREPDTTITVQGKEINIRKRIEPNKVVIPLEDDAFRK